MDWSFVWGILAALGVAVVALLALWRSLRKGYGDYMACIQDGIVTDAEKLKLADDLLVAIENARNVWSFVLKLIATFQKCKR